MATMTYTEMEEFASSLLGDLCNTGTDDLMDNARRTLWLKNRLDENLHQIHKDLCEREKFIGGVLIQIEAVIPNLYNTEGE